MATSITYEVAPENAIWIVRIPGDSVSESFAEKSEALQRARHLAARDHAGIRVLSRSGSVETELAPPARP